VLARLTDEGRHALMSLGREVRYAPGERLFAESEPADRFWVLRGGTVTLDLYVPGRGPVVTETVGTDELVGWSWLCPPHEWHLGAVAVDEVTAWEFPAAVVRALCARDPVLGRDLATAVASVIGRRLRAARTRLLDLYGPQGHRQAS
jgi:CRP-like cAMP-binding protein